MELTDIYNDYAAQYEQKAANWSYDKLHQAIMDDCYCEADFIHKVLQDEYGLETKHIFFNFEFLQKKWDKEKNQDLSSILLRQIKAFDPNVILVMNPTLLSIEMMQTIRKILAHEVHFISYYFSIVTEEIKQRLSQYELVLTGSNYYAKMIEPYSKNVKVVRHAFAPEIIKRVKKQQKVNKVGFTGSIFIGRNVHTNRVDLLSALKKSGIEFDYYGKVYGSFLNIKSFIGHFIQNPFLLPERIQMEKYLKSICKPSQFGLAYYETLAKYSINVNIHAGIEGTAAGNMRMFEVTGMGSCLVTDYRDENELLFDENKEIVVYRDYEELVDKVRYLLNHPEEAKRIALNGQKRTITDYNYRNKAISINRYIQDLI